MKIKIQKESKKFKPFDLTITLENEDEVLECLEYLKKSDALTVKQMSELKRKAN